MLVAGSLALEWAGIRPGPAANTNQLWMSLILAFRDSAASLAVMTERRLSDSQCCARRFCTLTLVLLAVVPACKQGRFQLASRQRVSKMRFACFLRSLALALLLVGSTAAGPEVDYASLRAAVAQAYAQQAAEMTESLGVLQSLSGETAAALSRVESACAD